jgi:hypothetical protein
MLPITILFALLGGLMVFLGAYVHLQKIEERKRIIFGLKNAVYLTIITIVFVYIFLFLIFAND